MNRKVPFLYKLSKVILGPIFKLYYSTKIIGKENIPSKGSIVIASNHIHLYDQCAVILSTKRGIHYMAKKEYFDNKFTKWFFKGSGCISVDRKGDASDAVETAVNVLKDGGAIGIFPEGTRNKTEDLLLPFKFGAVSMADKTDSYIVPVGVSGTYKFRSKDLTIKIGEPFKVENNDLEAANKKLFEEVKKLIEK